MANLARYANVQPSEFEQMLESDAVALSKQVDALRKGDQDFQVELTKWIVRSSGMRA
jgi:hypothetical protein